ncbi:MAG: c-type cytochrome [Pseudomonadota bacterium]|jgi:cytochrome c553|nr:c-type cytochrome [Rubrivivax sp.]MCZ8176019.1 c-type cytochrome [Burkholderiaceae bacterium]
MTKLAAPFLLALAGLVATAAHAQDVKRGEQRAAQCIGCHGIAGYQSSFPEVHRVPMISGQNAQYIVASLQAYAKGERKHPTMRGIAGMLTEQEMADLGAFYEQHGASMIKPVADTPARQPSAAVQALLTKGACASCHGVNFNKPINGAYPKIAGQHADYLYVSLRAYGIEGNRTVGRANGIMSAQVKPFTRAELKQMAEYIGSLPGDLRVVPQSRFR